MDRSITVAVIDDEKHMTDYLVKLLKDRFNDFFHVVAFNSAEEFLQSLRSMDISIIISDIIMPKTDGIELLKFISENYPDIKFLLLTAHPKFEHIYEANRRNVKYLLKLEDDDIIVQTIIDLLSADEKKLVSDNVPKLTSNEQLINYLKEYICKNYSANLSLENLARLVHFNPSYLSRLFKAHTNENIFEYVNRIRMEESARLLVETDYKVTEISEMTGYKTSGYFGYVFKEYFGTSPQVYRKMRVLRK